MIKINVISNNLKWKKYLSEPDLYIEKKIKKINKKENNYKKKIIYCTLLLSGDKEIRKLNKKFRKKKQSNRRSVISIL